MDSPNYYISKFCPLESKERVCAVLFQAIPATSEDQICSVWLWWWQKQLSNMKDTPFPSFRGRTERRLHTMNIDFAGILVLKRSAYGNRPVWPRGFESYERILTYDATGAGDIQLSTHRDRFPSRHGSSSGSPRKFQCEIFLLTICETGSLSRGFRMRY